MGMGIAVQHGQSMVWKVPLLRENKNLPPTILQNIFAIMVWDNGDFEEETLPGAGSTHVSHGICLQNQEVAQPEVNQPVHSIKKSTRSIKCTEENIPDFFQQKKVSPNLKNAESDLKMQPNTSIFQSQFRRFDFLAFVLIKLSLWLECADINFPAWTGFNTQRAKLLLKEPQQLTTITYLLVINAVISDMSTINHILECHVVDNIQTMLT